MQVFWFVCCLCTMNSIRLVRDYLFVTCGQKELHLFVFFVVVFLAHCIEISLYL